MADRGERYLVSSMHVSIEIARCRDTTAEKHQQTIAAFE